MQSKASAGDAGSRLLFTARPSRAPRRSWLGSRRGTALGLSLLLIGAALAAPAAAQDDRKTFTVDVAAIAGDTPNVFDFTVTLTNTSQGGKGLELGSANIVIPVGLTVSSVDPVVDVKPAGTVELVGGKTIEARDLALAPRDGTAHVTFQAAVDDCSTVEYEFTAVAKQSNDFKGTGNDLVLTNPEKLTISLDCALNDPYLEGLDTDACEIVPCSATVGEKGEQTFTASAEKATDASSLLIGLRTRSDAGDIPGAIASAFDDQCQTLVEPSLIGGPEIRLADAILQFEPSGFVGGEVRIDMVIPKSIVNQDRNRSADAFGVCFIGEQKAFSQGHASIGSEFRVPDPENPGSENATILASDLHASVPKLFGPVLLPLCTDSPAPCIDQRQKSGADVHISVRTLAKDPWMR